MNEMRNPISYKRRPANPQKMKMQIAASICIPKYDPTNPRGNDAHFIAADEQCIGVADGEHARQLINNSVLFLNVKKSPKQAVEEAYSKTTLAAQGSCCIVSFSGDERVLRAVKVGHSEFLVIRNRAVKFQSWREDDSLGTTNDDPSVAKVEGVLLGTTIVAEEIEVGGMEKGDVVLVGTDGVWDNMPGEEMKDILAMIGDLDLEELCSYVTKTAYFNSLDKDTGKIDDITLVVVRIE